VISLPLQLFKKLLVSKRACRKFGGYAGELIQTQ
jgi:hypothetical protein